MINTKTVSLACLLISICTTCACSAQTLPAVALPGKSAVIRSEFIYELEGRPTPECHASTIVETDQGLVASWFGGKHEKNVDVGIWVSQNNGSGWSAPVEVADGSEGESKDYPCWNPVLFQPKEASQNGKAPLLLFYKVGPDPRMWWGVLTKSVDGGKTWSPPRKLGKSEQLFPENQALLGPVKNKPIQLADGTILCPSSTENQGWRIHFELTRDQGKTWEVVGPLQEGEELDAIQPSVLTHRDGKLQILCRTQQGVVGTCWSKDQGRRWGPMQSTNLPNPNSGTDALTLDDGTHLLVYNHSIRGKKNGRQILNVATSDDGKDWKTVLTLENEGHPDGYSYPAVIQTADGLVHVTYTWRRETIKHTVIDPSLL